MSGREMQGERTKRFVLPQIAPSVAAGTYEPCTFDYELALPDADKTPGRKAWTDIFRRAIPQFEKRARLQLIQDASTEEEERAAPSQAASFAKEYGAILDKLEIDPDTVIPGYEADFWRAGGRKGLSCKVMCALRETCLARLGLRDAFRQVKRKENGESLQVLGHIVAEIEALESPEDRMALALRGCFAGNLFDLGAHFSSQKYDAAEEGRKKGGGAGAEEDSFASFKATRENLPARPWLVDCLDSAVAALSSGKFKKAIVFVDNAGSDLICGIFPFCRELLKAGTSVVLAANEKPAINDVTADELLALFTRIEGAPRVRDPLLLRSAESGRLRVVNSGSDQPIIDLSEISNDLADEADDADLVVLQGMGRAIESNLNASFASAVLKMGVVKHPEVALCLGGTLGDPICKFEDKATE